MALNKAEGAAGATSVLETQVDKVNVEGQTLKTPKEMAEALADEYFKYSKGAILLGADMTAGGDVSILEAGFESDNTPATITKLATAICDYWETFTTSSSEPAHGGTAGISVVVAATPMLPAMITAISGIISDPNKAGWSSFYDATELVVKTFVCTVTEASPTGPIIVTPLLIT